jgi:hypothetical protein
MESPRARSPVRELLTRLDACTLPPGLPHEACRLTYGDGFLSEMIDPLHWVTLQEVEEILAPVARADRPVEMKSADSHPVRAAS